MWLESIVDDSPVLSCSVKILGKYFWVVHMHLSCMRGCCYTKDCASKADGQITRNKQSRRKACGHILIKGGECEYAFSNALKQFLYSEFKSECPYVTF